MGAEGPADDSKILLSVVFPGTGNDPMEIKCKMTTKFEKVYKAVAENRGVAQTSFRLLAEGSVLKPHQTPAELDFEETQQIDYHMEQVGGGRPDSR